MPAIYDNHGNYIGDGGRLGAVEDKNIDDTFGGKIFRWLHPEQEASEYKGMGLEPPPETTIGDVSEAGVLQIQEQFHDALDVGVPILQKVAIGVVVVVAGIAFIQGMQYLKMITPRHK